MAIITPVTLENGALLRSGFMPLPKGDVPVNENDEIRQSTTELELQVQNLTAAIQEMVAQQDRDGSRTNKIKAKYFSFGFISGAGVAAVILLAIEIIYKE